MVTIHTGIDYITRVLKKKKKILNKNGMTSSIQGKSQNEQMIKFENSFFMKMKLRNQKKKKYTAVCL